MRHTPNSQQSSKLCDFDCKRLVQAYGFESTSPEQCHRFDTFSGQCFLNLRRQQYSFESVTRDKEMSEMKKNNAWMKHNNGVCITRDSVMGDLFLDCESHFRCFSNVFQATSTPSVVATTQNQPLAQHQHWHIYFWHCWLVTHILWCFVYTSLTLHTHTHGGAQGEPQTNYNDSVCTKMARCLLWHLTQTLLDRAWKKNTQDRAYRDGITGTGKPLLNIWRGPHHPLKM